jgi:hypothetical protein
LFVVARNLQEDSRLPYLVRLPLEGGIALKARDRWPATARVYCHRFEEAWPLDAEIVEQTPVLLCRRRGAAIDLVLDRPRQARSQFVFTQVKGREAIFWQTQKTVRAANPGARIPRRRTLTDTVTISVDTRERYPYRFARQGAETVRATVDARDYAVHRPDGALVAEDERKSLDNLASTLSDGSLAFQLQRLTELPLPPSSSRPATAPYSSSNTSTATGSPTNSPASSRYPEVQLVFADSRLHAEDWTHRFLTAALADASDPITTSGD